MWPFVLCAAVMGNFSTSSQGQKITAGEKKVSAVSLVPDLSDLFKVSWRRYCCDETALKSSEERWAQWRTRRNQEFTSGQDVTSGAKSKHPRNKELNFLKAARGFPISAAAARLRTLISDLHNFPRRDFMSDLGQGETRSGWRSCRGAATSTPGRDGGSIVMTPFIRSAVMSRARLRFIACRLS